MIHKSKWSIHVPKQTLPTFLFGSPTAPLPDKPCYIDAERPDRYVLKYEDYRVWAQRLAAGLRAAGLQKGDTLMLYSGNSIFFPIVLMGTIMASGIFTGANPTYNAREVAYQLDNSQAKFLLCADASLETALEAIKITGLGKDRLFVFDQGRDTFDGNGRGRLGCKHWTTLLKSPEEGRKFQWVDGEDVFDDTIALNYSSGTTGLPKGVEITHKNYVSNSLQHMGLMETRTAYAEKLPKFRWLSMTPMYHALAQTIYCVGGPSRRIPVYVMHRFDFQKMLEHVQNFKITELQLVPPMVVAMTKSPLVRQYDLTSVQYAGSGAAPLGAEVAAEFQRIWPPGIINLKQGYGMTETTCSVLGWDNQRYSDSFGVGEPNANVEIRLVDPVTEKDVPQGGRGELWARGPNIMKGYWRNPRATRETLTPDGWLRTGDVAIVDEKGIFFIVDRMKELIKVKGNQVAPAELEAQLLDHDSLADAAVVGVTINGEEHPRAYCVKALGRDISEQDVAKWMETKVSKNKRLTGGVKFVDAISKNPSGKILRKAYREQAAKEVGDAAKADARL